MRVSPLRLVGSLVLGTLFLGCGSPQPKADGRQVSSGVSAPKASPLTIQELRESEILDEPGAYFSLVKPSGTPSNDFFAYSDPAQETNLRVNQTLYRVKRISSKEVAKGQGSAGVGARTIEVWGNREITLELDYTLVSSGESNVTYTGQATVKKGGQQATFKIRGQAGC